MKTTGLCPHCDPYPEVANHYSEKLENLISALADFLNPFERVIQKFPQLQLAVNKAVLGGLFKILLALKLLREVEARDSDEGLFNRSLVVVREARKRGILIKAIKCLGKDTNYFSIETRGIKKFFEGLPHLTIEHTLPPDFDDKDKLKKLLQKDGLPHPQGAAFRDYRSAQRYVREVIGFPVVVKPQSGSLSRHTVCNVKDESQLQEAVKIAKMISPAFVVEEFIAGDVHRVTLINDEIVASCLREPPNVIGDGRHTIQELIEIKNQNPIRGATGKKNFTLHKITVTPKTTFLLAEQNLNLESVLPPDQKVYLHDKVILACGADIHDTTDKIHPENKNLFRKVAELYDAPLIGIDVITEDISKPYHEKRCAIIEVNSLPYIDMHHYPVTGKARDVAGCLLDYILDKNISF